MKKILLLGGSAQQIVAIETAKRLEYYTVLCDYLKDNPGQYHADKFYLISTTDKEEVLRVARSEKIDGILAYASDPAAPTAAYVAEKMNLPGNPYESVEILCNKDKFRNFLNTHGFNAPTSMGYAQGDSIENDLDKFNLPAIVKPVDSSGSKGVTVLRSWDRLPEAIDYAFRFSRCNRIIIEEFIEKKHEYLIGGDIFIKDCKIVMWGLMNCHRDSRVNPLVPVGKSFPLLLSESDVKAIQYVLQKIVTDLKLKVGSVNVELVVDKEGRVWPIDIGPRAGGNMIPDLLGMIFNSDVVEMAVLAAMGEQIKSDGFIGKGFYATSNLHALHNGVFECVKFSDTIEKHIIKSCLYKKKGDIIQYFDDASKAIGIVFMKFNSQEEMMEILKDINSHISIDVSNIQ